MSAPVDNPWTDYFLALNSAAFSGLWVASVCSGLQLLLLGIVVFRERNATSTRKSIALDLLLVSLILSNIANNVLVVAEIQANDYITYAVCVVLSNVTADLFQFLIMYWTWYRGFLIVEIVYPASIMYLRAVVILFGLLQATFAVLSVLSISPFRYNLQIYATILELVPIIAAIADVIVAVFDLFILGIFVAFLRKQKADKEVETTKLRMYIIARFGIVSFVVFQLILLLGVAFSYLFDPAMPEPIASVTICLIINDLGQYYLPLLYIFIQIGMKWAIVRAREKHSTGALAPTQVQEKEDRTGESGQMQQSLTKVVNTVTLKRI
ncbi:hypothetical protein BC830DRAFT_1168744 [Chytriomyces sp. MP71]|nr:hypothetical protein BC830DRAFT_1168744 [Chytriomyces sp. MP71]